VIGIIFVFIVWRFLVLTAGEVFRAAGLPEEAALFQARSALTGGGFTTSESEVVVNDPAARRAASALLIVGFVGPVTLIALFGFGFLLPTSEDPEVRAAILIGSLAILFVLERLGINARLGRRPAQFAAQRLFRVPAVALWTMLGDHAIGAVHISPDGPLAGSSLDERPFGDRSVTLLGIQRVDGRRLRHIAHPPLGELILPGDELIVYGDLSDLQDLRKATG